MTEIRSAIDRREALRLVSTLLGGAALVGSGALWEACNTDRRRQDARVEAGLAGGLFTQADVSLLDEIADTILPETKTPGAKAAGVGPFIAMMVTDCYEAREQEIFRDGLKELDGKARATGVRGFIGLDKSARLTLLQLLDREQHGYMQARRAEDPPHYFRMIKELSLLGYFTSEIGCTVAQRYVESPGRFDPCIAYAAGTPSWASHA